MSSIEGRSVAKVRLRVVTEGASAPDVMNIQVS